ncbi:conserved hypothetical protein [Candidatus Sulfopaludibacter sp. SbA3]|nr:conserved hypothetical protein [Candidatus Sulfopaludibacter sp. SbA3]
MAREHGVFRTARILRLEYGKLKHMAESATAVRRAPAPAEFLELVALPGTSSGSRLSECLIELEGPRGKRCASSGKGPRRRTWLH